MTTEGIARDLKITKNSAYTAKKTALKPIMTSPLLKAIYFDAAHLPVLPMHEPPLNL